MPIPLILFEKTCYALHGLQNKIKFVCAFKQDQEYLVSILVIKYFQTSFCSTKGCQSSRSENESKLRGYWDNRRIFSRVVRTLLCLRRAWTKRSKRASALASLRWTQFSVWASSRLRWPPCSPWRIIVRRWPPKSSWPLNLDWLCCEHNVQVAICACWLTVQCCGS